MKIKANILLITLFLLMMSSLSALLVTAYIRNLIKSSAIFHNYYKSYYVANAGLELALVKTNGKVRGFGFEDQVATGATIVADNFTGSKAYFSSKIVNGARYLGDVNTAILVDNNGYSTKTCTNDFFEISYTLPPGGCVPIILVTDNKLNGNFSSLEGSIAKIPDGDLRPVKNNSLPNIVLYGDTTGTTLLTKVDNNFAFLKGWSKEFSVSDLQEGKSNLLGQFNDTIGTSDNSPTVNDRLILMIANTTSNTGQYCIDGGDGTRLPTQYVNIESKGTFGNITLNLKGVRKAGLPADFCYTAISN